MTGKSYAILAVGAALTISLWAISTHGQPSLQPLTNPAPGLKASGPTQAESYAWKPVAIGGGGFITGLSIDRDGMTLVGRSDVHGAWLWDKTLDRWVLLTTAERFSAEQRQNGVNEGAYEVTVAPANGARIYMAIKGAVYRSDDQGASWSRPKDSPFPANLDPNAATRLYGAFIAVSPQDQDLLTFGPPDGKLWVSHDGARSWTEAPGLPRPVKVADVPGPRAPGTISWFTPGKGEDIWAMVSGKGMFVSRDKGRTFRALPNKRPDGPLVLQQGSFAKDGSFLGVDPVAQTVWKYQDGGWTNLAGAPGMSRHKWGSVAVNPRDGTIFVFDEGGRTLRSQNGGDRWWPVYRRSEAGRGDAPWHRLSNQGYFATGMVIFDPVVADRMWVGAGFGVFRAQVPGLAAPLTWQSQSRGIEEIVATDIAQTPGNAPLFAGWDFGIHVKPDLDAFSTTYGPRERVVIAAQQIATTAADPQFVVTNASDTRQGCCSEDGQSVLAGYSQDGGRTWQRFASLPTPPGTSANDPWRMAFGTIAVAANDTANIVWEPTYNRAPFYTKDRGKTWKRVTFEGERPGSTGAHGTYTMTRKTLTADRVLPHTFYLVHSGNKSNAALTGLWRTRDGGQRWERIFTGEIAPFSAGSAKLRAVPAHAGHLFFTSGLSGPPDTFLRRSTDGGRSWNTVADVKDVDDLAFGKAARDGTYPAIYLSGKVKGQYGIWRSTDDARTWHRLVDFPAGRLDQVTSVGADPDNFGRVYVGYMGSGFIYGEPARCRDRDAAGRTCSLVR